MFEEESVETTSAATPLEHARGAGRVAHITGRDPFASSHRSRQAASADARIAELEVENLRLQRLVAELLIKNQQLRKPRDEQTP